MRLVRNTAIRFAAVMVCVIAMLLSATLTVIVSTITFFVAPICIAAYAADFAWTGNEKRSARWEMTMYRTQSIFALPASAVIAIASSINDSLRLKIR